MKILLANKFYYRRGGDCIVTMGLEELLRAHGHEVAVFAMDYPENVSAEQSETVARWGKYWPSNMSKIKAFTRPFGDSEVRKKFTQLIEDFRPDVVHLHNIHTQLSPVIAEIAHEKGIKVFWTLHDTKLVCPCYTCMKTPQAPLRRGDAAPKMQWCEECFTDKTAVIKHKCMPGSVPGAVIGYLEQKKWNREALEKYTTLFLPPSQFMADTCIRGGYSKEKMRVLCNFIDVEKVANPNFKKGDYYCYLGRVTEVKGIRTLCEAAKQLPYKLVVIGGGDILDELRETYPGIEFLGQKDWKEFRPVLEGAKFMVLPSEWSENNPLTVIESQSLGTPVLGARIGGIPELITEYEDKKAFGEKGFNKNQKNPSAEDEPIGLVANACASECSNELGTSYTQPSSTVCDTNSSSTEAKNLPTAKTNLLEPSETTGTLKLHEVPNGMTFESGNVDDLKEKIKAMWEAEFDYETLAKQAVERYSSEAYYERLMEVYRTL